MQETPTKEASLFLTKGNVQKAIKGVVVYEDVAYDLSVSEASAINWAVDGTQAESILKASAKQSTNAKTFKD